MIEQTTIEPNTRTTERIAEMQIVRNQLAELRGENYDGNCPECGKAGSGPAGGSNEHQNLKSAVNLNRAGSTKRRIAMADDIEIQKLNESDPAKAELMLEMGRLLVEEFSERQPKRFKVFVETVMSGLPPRFKIEARLAHDSEWVDGFCDDLEGAGSLSLVPDIHDGEWFGFRPA